MLPFFTRFATALLLSLVNFSSINIISYDAPKYLSSTQAKSTKISLLWSLILLNLMSIKNYIKINFHVYFRIHVYDRIIIQIHAPTIYANTYVFLEMTLITYANVLLVILSTLTKGLVFYVYYTATSKLVY